MRITSVTTTLVNIDTVSDYLPVASTVTNLVDLFLKSIYVPRASKESLKNHYIIHLKHKSALRCLTLLIPVIGNIVIALYDFYAKRQGAQLLKQAESSTSSKLALEYYKQASALGNGQAKNELGLGYNYGGYSLSIDKKVAFNLFEEGALTGTPSALSNLAECYRDGEGVEKDRALYRELNTRAALAGDTRALYREAWHYEQGQGVTQSIDKAIELYTSAANKGDSDSMFELGRIYEDRNDPKKALDYYKKAASYEDKDALLALSEVYRKGILGEAPSFDLYSEYLNRAAHAENEEANYRLGMNYLNAENGYPEEPGQAETFLREAADRDHPAATNILGDVYYNKVPLQKNRPIAVEYYKKAMSLGNVDGKMAYAYCLLQGHGVEKDVKAAIKNFEDVAQQNSSRSAEADLQLYTLYRLSNRPKAFDHLKKAAQGGNPKAQFTLGCIYEGGLGGTPVQRDVAIELFTKSAEGGDQRARTRLEQLGIPFNV